MATSSFEDLLGQEGISTISELTNTIKSLGASLVNALGPALMTVTSLLIPFVNIAGALIGVLNDLGILVPIVGGTLGFLAAKSLALSVASFSSALGKVTENGAFLPFPLNIAAIGAGVGAVTAAMVQAKAVDDFKSGPGGINYMSGPAGAFKLNPRDSVLATTKPIK